MSNYKMSDWFSLPLRAPSHDHIVLWDHNDEFVAVEFLGIEQTEAAAHAINSHDALTARVTKLEAALNHVLKMQTRGYVVLGDEFNKMADEALEDKS
jgi:hypothetical protein